MLRWTGIVVLLAGCSARDIVALPVCEPVAYQCSDGFATVTPGDDGALVLENDRITAVIDGLGSPQLLAPSGGNLRDLGARGAPDTLNQIYQVAGILPDDAFHYTSLEVTGTVVVARGTLDGRPDVSVITRYELRPCEPGVRVHSELYNGGREAFTFFVADVAYWGGRGPIPFTPLPGQGFLQPDLDLVTLDSWAASPYVATSSGLAWVSCSRDRIEGVNDDQVTALGEPRQIVDPGERVVYDRFLVAGAGDDVEAAAREAHELRRQLGRDDALTLAKTGQVTLDDGAPPPQRVDLVASVVGQDGQLRPFTQTHAGADGRYALELPADAHVRVHAWSFGRIISGYDLVDVARDQELPTIAVPAPATLALDTAGRDTMIVLVPADADTRAATTGTELGRFDACAPWLGPPHGEAPACNRTLVRGNGLLLVPAGHYFVYASAGPFATLARAEITVAARDTVPLAFELHDLGVLAPGLLSADLHVHGAKSFDSAIPDEDRVLSFAAAGMDVIAATDHDAVADYADALAALGLEDRITVLAGVETTGLIPFMAIPGDDFPRVIGHFNFWPLEDGVGARLPFDELTEPGALFDAMDALMPAHGLKMLNHPWDEPLFGRDLGYLRAVGYDPRKPIPAADDGTAQGVLARHRNLDFDLLEVLNGDSTTKFLQYRQIWWALLSDGHVYAGAANSDSHALDGSQLGWPRNLVRVAGGDPVLFDEAVRAGHMVGGYGIVIEADVNGVPFGLTPISPPAGAELRLVVRAAPWIPVDEVRIVVNGQVVRTLPVTATPADPFGEDGLERLSTTIPLAELVPAGVDAWLLIEAGLPLPEAADLDDDGVVDTTDNDGDGRIDLADVEDGEDSGPLTDPADPDPWSDDSRRHVAAIAPGTWPTAFTNPWLLDLDGDGAWEAPRP